MLVGLYGNTDDAKSPERRYSPAQCIGTVPTVVTGRPDPSHIFTSFVERQTYNVIKIHTTLRVTLAMEANITTPPYDVMDLVNLLIESEKKAA